MAMLFVRTRRADGRGTHQTLELLPLPLILRLPTLLLLLYTLAVYPPIPVYRYTAVRAGWRADGLVKENVVEAQRPTYPELQTTYSYFVLR